MRTNLTKKLKLTKIALQKTKLIQVPLPKKKLTEVAVSGRIVNCF